MTTDNASPRYLDKLASLRFFAALLVVLFHLRVFANLHRDALQADYVRLFSWGYSGVSIFFVLSGFVISYANENWRGWKRYLVGRFTRIYPAHWIVLFTFGALTIVALFRISGADLEFWSKLVTNGLLVHAFIPDQGYFFSLTVVTWSLSVEIFFYLMFLFLRRLSDSHIYILSVYSYLFLVMAAQALRYYMYVDIYWDFYIDPLARLPEFIAGMAVYRLYKNGKLPRLWFKGWNFIVIFVGLILAEKYFYLIPRDIISHKIAFTYAIIPLPFCVLMLIAILDESSNGYLRNKILVLLGEASFALYLIHRVIIDYVYAGINRDMNAHIRASDAGVFSIMLFVLVGTVLLSVIFYKYVELPVTSALRNRLAKYVG